MLLKGMWRLRQRSGSEEIDTGIEVVRAVSWRTGPDVVVWFSEQESNEIENEQWKHPTYLHFLSE